MVPPLQRKLIYLNMKSMVVLPNIPLLPYIPSPEKEENTKVEKEIKLQFIDVKPEDYFADVDASHYYAKAVQWAVSNGITKGTDKNTFNPNAECNRAQILTFLYRFSQLNTKQ